MGAMEEFERALRPNADELERASIDREARAMVKAMSVEASEGIDDWTDMEEVDDWTEFEE